MKTTIPLSNFHQLTPDSSDLSTEITVNTGDGMVEIRNGSNKLFLNREQVEQLHECLGDWLSDDPNSQRWSDFWSAALK